MYRDDADDADLVREGVTERRIVVTQDRGLLMRRALWGYVRGDRPDDQLADVLDRFAPPLAPLTRCTACNGEVDAVAPEEVADRRRAGRPPPPESPAQDRVRPRGNGRQRLTRGGGRSPALRTR